MTSESTLIEGECETLSLMNDQKWSGSRKRNGQPNRTQRLLCV